MKRRRDRRLALLVGAVVAAAAIVAACTFPDVAFAPAGGADGATADVAPGDAGGGDANEAKDANDTAPTDADVRDDAHQRVDEAGCKDPCDCDQDYFPNKSCAEAGAPPGTVDCDDFDPLRKPDAGYVATKPDPSQVPFGDWNCDNRVDKQYGDGLKCSSLAGCSGQGFVGTPECGDVLDYSACQSNVVTCTAAKIDSRAQGCK